jgi:hypothetical protein
MCRQQRNQECALGLSGPWEITEKGLSIRPDKCEVEQWQSDVENGDMNGRLSFLESQFLTEFRH